METEKAGKTNGSNLWFDSEDTEQGGVRWEEPHCSWAPADLTLQWHLLYSTADSCCRRSWATLVCGSYLLPWGKDNFPGCPKPRFSLLLLLVCTQPRLQNSAQALPPTENPFAPAHSLLPKHGCSGYPARTETHSAMTVYRPLRTVGSF